MESKTGNQIVERTLAERRFETPRKNFIIALRENQRGKFLRITEVGVRNRNQYDNVIVPEDGFADLKKYLLEVLP